MQSKKKQTNASRPTSDSTPTQWNTHCGFPIPSHKKVNKILPPSPVPRNLGTIPRLVRSYLVLAGKIAWTAVSGRHNITDWMGHLPSGSCQPTNSPGGGRGRESSLGIVISVQHSNSKSGVASKFPDREYTPHAWIVWYVCLSCFDLFMSSTS